METAAATIRAVHERAAAHRQGRLGPDHLADADAGRQCRGCFKSWIDEKREVGFSPATASRENSANTATRSRARYILIADLFALVLRLCVGHVDRSRATYWADADRLRKWRPSAVRLGEALHDLLPVSGCGVPERDPTVEIDPFERSRSRIALRPLVIGQLLLGSVCDGACTEEDGEAVRPDNPAQSVLAQIRRDRLLSHVRPCRAQPRLPTSPGAFGCGGGI